MANRSKSAAKPARPAAKSVPAAAPVVVAAPIAAPVIAVATQSEIDRLRAMKLSGTVGYIHDKLTLAKRNIARRWWRNVADENGNVGAAIAHTYRGRWASHPVPAELCAAMGVTCHPAPRA